MKSARRFMVFLTGFACLAFASAPPAIVNEAKAATITYPKRIYTFEFSPYGAQSDLKCQTNR